MIRTPATRTGICGGRPCSTSTTSETEVVMREVRACREAHPDHYVKLTAYDASLGRQTTALSFIVGRPPQEPGYRIDRTDAHDRVQRYGLHPYSTDRPAGRRYTNTNGTST